uniref:Uncharacterized protein n=1 Tax=Nocardia terpenica TaxID=455432 RepID=A0A809PVJ9_9NOCA|nr:hypothetical protein [Nocardia terpenica]
MTAFSNPFLPLRLPPQHHQMVTSPTDWSQQVNGSLCVLFVRYTEGFLSGFPREIVSGTL